MSPLCSRHSQHDPKLPTRFPEEPLFLTGASEHPRWRGGQRRRPAAIQVDGIPHAVIARQELGDLTHREALGAAASLHRHEREHLLGQPCDGPRRDEVAGFTSTAAAARACRNDATIGRMFTFSTRAVLGVLSAVTLSVTQRPLRRSGFLMDGFHVIWGRVMRRASRRSHSTQTCCMWPSRLRKARARRSSH